MSFDDEIRDALRAEADRVAPAADAWDRTSAVASAAPGRRRGPWLLAAAAAVLVIAGVVGAAALGGDEQGVDSVDQPTTSSTTATSLATGDVDRPDEIVAVDATGHVIVVDVETGETIRELAYDGDPNEPGGEGGPTFISNVEVSPDRAWVYYEHCCEPAAGVIHRVPYGGGEPEHDVAFGSYPALSPDGRMLALSELGHAVAIQPPVAATPADRISIEESSLDWYVGHVGWAVDGSRLFADRFLGDHGRSEVLVYDFDGSSLTRSALLSPPDGVSWRSAIGRSDGDVLVAADSTDGSGDSVATVLDPETGAVVTSFELGGQARSIAYDSSGTWLTVSLGRLVRWFDADGGWGEIPGAAGWLDADW